MICPEITTWDHHSTMRTAGSRPWESDRSVVTTVASHRRADRTTEASITSATRHHCQVATVTGGRTSRVFR